MIFLLLEPRRGGVVNFAGAAGHSEGLTWLGFTSLGRVLQTQLGAPGKAGSVLAQQFFSNCWHLVAPCRCRLQTGTCNPNHCWTIPSSPIRCSPAVVVVGWDTIAMALIANPVPDTQLGQSGSNRFYLA